MKTDQIKSIFIRSTEPLSHFAGKRVAVLGHTGFYGSWIKALLEYANTQGYGITILPYSRSNGFDITNTGTYAPIMLSSDYIINCAGDATGQEDLVAHVFGSSKLRVCMRKSATLLHFSSGAAKDSDTPYAEAKRQSEKLLLEIGGNNQIVRPFATVGFGMGLDKPFAISAFIKARLANEPLTVVTGIWRSFAHVSDLIPQCLHVAVHGDGKPYEVGSDNLISIEEAAKLISDNIAFVSSDSFATNARSSAYSADLGRIKNQFNLSLDFDSKAAILRTLNDYLEQDVANKTSVQSS